MSAVTESTPAGGPPSGGEPLLTVEALEAGYGPIKVLHGIDFTVGRGQIVVILGANGAGKTTTMRALSGMVPVRGTIRIGSDLLSGRKPEDAARLGVAHVPQGRGTITDLSVEENLSLGAYLRKDDDGIAADIERWYGYFPRLAERRAQSAGSLSGGEQQMLALSRALMLRPRLLLLDEPSLGLAPNVVQDLFRVLAEINREQGTTMLIVEQNANLALAVASYAYVLEAGRVALSGPADQLQADENVRRAYLGY